MLHSRRALPRLHQLSRHLRRASTASGDAPNAATIRAMEVADDPELWRQAGFAVSDKNVVMLGDCAVTLSGAPGVPSKGLVSWAIDKLANDFNGELLEGVTTRAAPSNSSEAPAVPATSPHANTTLALAELVLYVQNLEQTYQNFTRAGLVSHKGRPPKEMKGGKHASAIFFLGGIRLMMTGPTDPKMPADQNPKMWMFGTGSAPTELRGWLPVVADIKELKGVLGDKAGDIKKAAQEGRQICSLAPERSGLTGTFAFLEDGAGSVF